MTDPLNPPIAEGAEHIKPRRPLTVIDSTTTGTKCTSAAVVSLGIPAPSRDATAAMHMEVLGFGAAIYAGYALNWPATTATQIANCRAFFGVLRISNSADS